MKKKLWFKIGSVIIVLVILSYGILQFIEGDKQLSIAIKEYPQLKYEDELGGVISENFHLQNSRDIDSFVRLKFSNGKKYAIAAMNVIEDDKTLREVCNFSSKIIKKTNSDTLDIIDNGEKHKFVLYSH